MTKKDIVKSISEEIDLPQQKIREIVQKTLDSIVDVLIEQGSIELRNFGVFKVKTRKAHVGRNPRTGEVVKIEVRKTVSFKPGKKMIESVCQKSQEAKKKQGKKTTKKATSKK